MQTPESAKSSTQENNYNLQNVEYYYCGHIKDLSNIHTPCPICNIKILQNLNIKTRHRNHKKHMEHTKQTK